MSALEGSLLLIEDDGIDAELVLRGLKRIPRSSLEIRWVTSLAEAQAAITEHQPQILLTDLTLPDARNLEVVTALRSLCADASLIVQTGIDDDRTPIAALELGAQDFLPKGSITPDVLGRAIRYALARSRTQAELIRAQLESEQSAHELDDFAHVVAHDLRAPVRTARLFADRLLHEMASDNETILDYGTRLETSLEKVDRMILSMLDYASLRGLGLHAEEVCVAPCVAQSVQLVKGDLAEANGAIRLNVDRGLVVAADEEQLNRVLLNLLSNAVKYRSDHIGLEIDVSARLVGSNVVIDVIDNGPGVSDSDAERAFEVLERLDPCRANGLGFGLAISRRIIEGFGGTIRFIGNRSVGAQVQIVLPAV